MFDNSTDLLLTEPNLITQYGLSKSWTYNILLGH